MSNETILYRIKKLMALANSTNEHEAALAARKAQELLQEHSLSMSDVDGLQATNADPVLRSDYQYTNGNHITWKIRLAHQIATNNSCSLITSGRTLVFLGRKSDVEVVKFLFEDLSVRLEQLVKTELRRVGHPGKGYSNSWLLGATQGIGNQMYAAQQAFKQAVSAGGNSGMSLMIVKEREVKEFKKIQFPHLRSGPRMRISNSDAFHSGVQTGENMSLHRGYVGAGGNGKLLR